MVLAWSSGWKVTILWFQKYFFYICNLIPPWKLGTWVISAIWSLRIWESIKSALVLENWIICENLAVLNIRYFWSKILIYPKAVEFCLSKFVERFKEDENTNE